MRRPLVGLLLTMLVGVLTACGLTGYDPTPLPSAEPSGSPTSAPTTAPTTAPARCDDPLASYDASDSAGLANGNHKGPKKQSAKSSGSDRCQPPARDFGAG